MAPGRTKSRVTPSDKDEKQQTLELELAETKQKLSYTEFQLETLLNHMEEGLIFINPDGFITRFPAASQTLLNINQVCFPSHWDQLFDDTFFGFSISKCLLDKTNPSCHLLTLHPKTPNEPIKYLHAHGFYVSHKSSINVRFEFTEGLLIILRDVSEIHHSQALIQRDQRLQQLGQLTRRLAHEIRNPLTAIEGFASLLSRDLKEKSSSLEMIHSIQEASQNINRLVNDILNYGRVITPNLITQNIVETVKQAVEAAQVSGWTKKEQSILFSSPLDFIEASHDREMIKSCLSHLIKNGLQAIPEKGEVTITLHPSLDQLKIRVTDTGCGIRKEDLERLFTPFFSTKTDGNGLGLCEVSQMMASHKGRVEVSSTLDKGTAFSLVFPLINL